MLRCTKVIKTTDSGGFLLDMSMKAFFLNFTRIVETNPRIYWSIIFGLAACLALFVAEIVHIQLVINELNTKDQNVLAEAILPLATKYKWSRIFAIILALFWSNMEYLKAKKTIKTDTLNSRIT